MNCTPFVLKILFLGLFMTFLLLPSSAQDFQFGRIDQSFLESTTYDQDEEAEALVLFDLGKSYFVRSNGSFDVIFERSTRIKIFTEAGLNYAEVEIPFYQEGGVFEKVYDLEAYSYSLEEGRIIRTALDMRTVFDEKVNEYWNLQKFAIPNVKSGSVVEYRYKISSQYKSNLRDWEFQKRIPTVYSEYEVKMIPFYEYDFILQGASKFDDYSSHVERGLTRRFGSTEFNDQVFKFVMKNVPAFRDESYITSINDYIIKVDFQLAAFYNLQGYKTDLMTTWAKMNEDLLKNRDFGGFMNQSRRAAASELDIRALQNTNDPEKLDRIIDHVKTNYRWNNRNGKYAEKTFRQFSSEKQGNVANVNLFLAGLLQGAGLEAHPAILSTRANGKIRSMNTPFHHYFNYVVVLVTINGENRLVDASDALTPNRMIPVQCINDRALIVKKGQEEWVSLQIKEPSEINRLFLISFSETLDSLITDLSISSTGYDALRFRKWFGGNPKNIEDYLNSAGYQLAEDRPLQILPEETLDSYRFQVNTIESTRTQESRILISPFLREPLKENPFKQRTRTYPVDYIYPEERIFDSRIKLPDDYAIEHVPANLNISNNLLDFSYETSLDEGHLIVKSRYYLKKSIYPTQDYSRLRYFMQEIVKRLNEEIILVKKT
jgi:hypothetical protein